MKRISSLNRITVTGVCIALCYILPLAFHSTALGTTLSPMHIPVLLCGMVCGSWYGLFCGIVGPILSSVLSGMPPATMLISMIPELATYGLVTGLLMKLVRTKNLYADMYISLSVAMILGRVVGGIAKALFYMGNGEVLTLSVWATGYFVSTAPGILCHLILIPILVVTLMHTRLIPKRYSKGE